MQNKKLLAATTALALGLAACEQTPQGVKEDKAAAAAALDRLNDSQPVPSFSWSQIRQNLIEITEAQAETTQTTSFFFHMGVAAPVASCPSIGFPIPSTAQLTNPSQVIRAPGDGSAVISQVEQTGIYTGDSSGTYVMCVDAQGEAYAFYWEGYVAAISGPAEWSSDSNRVELIGDSSFDFTSGRS